MAPSHPDAPPEDRTTPWRVDPAHRRHRPAGHGHPHRHPHPAPAAERPAVAEGVQLLGEFEGSGYTEPHYLARKADGSVVQLTKLLFHVAEAADGRRDHEQIAAEVSQQYGKSVSADNVATLVEKLRPLGVLTNPDGSSPDTEPADPLLGLRWRVSLVGERATRLLTLPFRPLFLPPVIAVAVVALLGYDAWLFFVHGLAQGLRGVLEQPLVFLLVAGLVVVSAALHEIGHATACVYSGGRPGRMGAGVYLAWPAFYTDVTDAYRLNRAGRLRTDLGGIYFNGMVVLALGAVYWLTGFEPLLLVSFLLQIEIVHQLLPFLRLDGYYVLSDVAGVPDLFRRIGPVLRSALPGHHPDKQVTELKRWVRVMVTVWVLVVVPLLLVNLTLVVVSVPRVLATAWDSGAKLVYQFEHAGALGRVVDVLQLLFLAVPIAGLVFTLVRVSKRASGGAWRWSAGSVGRRAIVLVGGATLVGLLALAWWPDGRVTPYRQGERGTLTESVSSVGAVGSGHPLLRGPAQAATQPLAPVRPGTTAAQLARTGASATGASTTTRPGSTGTTSTRPGQPATGTTGTSPSPAPGTAGGTTGGGTAGGSSPSPVPSAAPSTGTGAGATDPIPSPSP